MFFRTLSKWPLKISKNAEFAQPFGVTSSSISVIVRREFSLHLFGIHHFAALDSLVLFLNFSSFLFCGETCLVSLIMFHIQIFLFEKKKKSSCTNQRSHVQKQIQRLLVLRSIQLVFRGLSGLLPEQQGLFW